jgi:hypothetical protein
VGGTLPLTLDCVCPTADIGVCELLTLTLVVDINETFKGTPAIGASHNLTFYADKLDPMAPTVIMLSPASGEHTFDLPIADWASHWDTYSVELVTDASLSQIPSPPYSAYDKFWAAYYIRQDYLCTNGSTSAETHPTARATTKAPANDSRCEISTDIRAICYSGQGVGSLFYHSTPLGTCNGCTISDSQFEPVVDAVTKVDITSGAWCLCVSGGSGSGPYSFSISGKLPCGMSLDPSSGCISGTPDGQCAGTDQYIFSVVDLVTHEFASVTCAALGISCGTATPTIGNQAY